MEKHQGLEQVRIDIEQIGGLWVKKQDIVKSVNKWNARERLML